MSFKPFSHLAQKLTVKLMNDSLYKFKNGIHCTQKPLKMSYRKNQTLCILL